MIDTWPRHLAAVGEARRLIGLVLQNNALFRTFGGADGMSPAPTAIPAELAADPQFAAYVHLTKAIEALRPIPTAGDFAVAPDRPLSEAIQEIEPAVGVSRATCAVAKDTAERPSEVPGLDDLASLRARLRYVLEDAPTETVPVPVRWCATGEEARVSIVRAPPPTSKGAAVSGEMPKDRPCDDLTTC